MSMKPSAYLLSALLLVGLLSACTSATDPISCVTSLDCPAGWTCEEGLCIEGSGQTQDTATMPDPDTTVMDDTPIDQAGQPDDANPDTTPPDALVTDGTEPADDEDALATETDETVDEDVAVTDTTADEDVPLTDAVTDAVTDAMVDEDTTVTDTAVDLAADEDVVTDDVTPDVDNGLGNTGAACAVPGDCTGSNVCAEVFTSQDTNFCYLNCTAPNESLCNGTAWPECVVVGTYALCLAPATIVGSFDADVDAFVSGNNVALTIDGTTHIQVACSAYQNTANDWVLQCSKILQSTPNKIQLDAVFFWPQAAHAVGTVAGAEGQVYETTYNASNQVIDNWMRAFFLDSDGSVTLTAAGTTTGAAVTGSINFTGNAYNAQFAP